MKRDNERQAILEIAKISQMVDYSNTKQIISLLDKFSNRSKVADSIFGVRYVKRLESLLRDGEECSCVLCGKEASNKVVCQECIEKLSPLNELDNEEVKDEVLGEYEKQIQKIHDEMKAADQKTENLFKDIDASMLSLASQRTARTTKKLAWTILTLTIINTIGLVFIALFLWKLNLG